MSQLTYNGVVLENVKATFSEEAISSDDGGEYLYTKFTIDATAVYNPGATSYTSGGSSASAFPAVTDAAIRHALMEKQKPLTFADEAGNVIIASPPAPGGVQAPCDCKAGPHPISCSVRQIVGSKTWLVSYRVETFLDQCPSNTTPEALISNRYGQSHSIDQNQMLTITTTGIAHFRMDMLLSLPDQSADQFRDRCLPALPLGFQRQSVQVTLGSLGNVLSYTVVDRQVYVYIGQSSKYGDVLRFAGSSFEHTTQGPEGMPMPFNVRGMEITVTGKADALKANLFWFAASMIAQRLNIGGGGGDPLAAGGSGIVIEAAAMQHEHEPVVSMRVSVKVAAAQQSKPGWAVLRNEFMQADGAVYQTSNPILANDGGSPQLPGDLNTRGLYAGELMVPALKAACSRVYTAKPPKVPSSGGTAQTYPNQAPAVSVSQDTTQPVATLYSSDNTDPQSYSTYRIDTRWDKDLWTMQVPVAGNGSGSPLGTGSSGGGSGYGPPNTSCEFLVLAAPTSNRVVEWTAERTGAAPALPLPNLNDPNYVLLRSSITPTAPTLMNDGETAIVRVSGRYTWGVANAIGAGDSIPTCVLPSTSLGFDDWTLGPANFYPGILGDGSGGGSGGGNNN